MRAGKAREERNQPMAVWTRNRAVRSASLFCEPLPDSSVSYPEPRAYYGVDAKNEGANCNPAASPKTIEDRRDKNSERGCMFARKTIRQLFINAAFGIAALLLVGVLLAAMPNHHTPAVATATAERAQDSESTDHGSMPGMTMDADDASVGEHNAMIDMQHMHHGDTPHMHMTAPRPANASDEKRADEIAAQLRAGIEKYRDYRVALNEGYKIFMPNIPQQEYHFTNYENGFLEAFAFDPARPTSLLYKKTASGYELVGAMYTMPKRATEEQLNERVPLSVASWHLHTNLCMPPKGDRRHADWTKFGLRGSITSESACHAAGGTFYPVIFGWMVHVYPYEDTTAKIFAMHHHD